MSSFRSNLNGVPSTTERLIAFKNRITTCFQHWCRKLSQNQSTETPTDSNNNHALGHRKPFQQWLELKHLKDYENLRKTNQSFYELQAALARNLQTSRDQQSNQSATKIEIIAKLLSSTVIATKNSETTTNTTNTNTIEEIEESTAELVNSNGRKMTILEDTFVLIREENPDLDKEIRSILMSRAQTGATIGQIKEDYRKNTGTIFPVYDHITDFLLCIPGIMAFCTESGTRIFTVQPTEKTKHIYNMVMNQKAPSERSSTSTYHNNHENNQQNHYNWRSRDSGFNSNRASDIPPPAPWRRHFTRQRQPTQQQQQQLVPPPQRFQQPLINAEEPNSRDNWNDNRNGYYHDNCQYLINRIYNGSEQSAPNSNNIATIEQNLMDDYNNLLRNHNNNVEVMVIDDTTAVNVSETIPFSNQPIQVETDVFKRPIGRAVRAVAQSTSPSGGTRSCQTNDSMYGSDSEAEAKLLDFPLLGDDFFLYLARMELKCKFKKYMKALQSGLCVSGQTIKAAIKRVNHLPYNHYPNRRVIVNIGSVDIMQGRPLVQIEHDYRNLINIINKRGLQPIVTTLAPLANYTHDSSTKAKVERFNEFIKREGQYLVVIDIWSIFVNEKKQTLFDCYQNEPRRVTGAKEPYVFWNKIGRQRVLQLIETNLEY